MALQTSPLEIDRDVDVRNAAIEIMLDNEDNAGDSYFEHLTHSLARYFALDGVYLFELSLDPERATLLAFHQSETFPQPLDFTAWPLCDEVLERGRVLYPQGALRQYRFDKVVRSARVEALIGIPLQRGLPAGPLGELFILHGKPLKEAEFIEAVIDQLSRRIVAELERRQRDLAQKRDYARLRMLTTHSGDASFYVQLAPVTKVHYVSTAVESMFGLAVEAFHANPDLLLDKLRADERRSLEELLTASSRDPVTVSVRLPNGETRWVEYRAFAVRDRQGKLAGIGGTIRDVTCWVDAEEAVKARNRYLQDLLSALPETLLLLRSDGQVMDYVPGEIDLGLGRPEQLRGRHVTEIMSPGMVGALEQTMRATLRSHRVQRVQFVVPGSKRRLHDVRCLPFGSGSLLLVLRDLTSLESHDRREERGHLGEDLDERSDAHATATLYGLTTRELAVLSLIVEGMADKQIADALAISIYTVNKHVGNVLGKMNAVSRTEAGVRAVKEGLLPRDTPREAITA